MQISLGWLAAPIWKFYNMFSKVIIFECFVVIFVIIINIIITIIISTIIIIIIIIIIIMSTAERCS